MKTPWQFDLSHSNIHFAVRHLMVSKVRGQFASWRGQLLVDPDDLTKSSVEVEIDAASVESKEPKRDEHLRSADFLDAATYPHVKFRGTGVTKVDDSTYKLTGDLTIRDVTRPVTLEVEYAGTVKDPWGGERAGFSAKTTINRKDYGLTWNMVLEAGGFVVGDKIEIGIEVEAVKEAAQPVAAAPAA
jgi:polyisoprenoid-binding protein YceI